MRWLPQLVTAPARGQNEAVSEGAVKAGVNKSQHYLKGAAGVNISQ